MMLRSLLFLILIAAPVAGEEKPGLSTMEILRHEEVAFADKLKALKAAKPDDELRKATTRGDHRFLDLTGFGAVPGIENWSPRLEKKYGAMVIGSGWSMIVDDDQEDYEKALEVYATRYNQLLFAQLGEVADPVVNLDALTRDQQIDALIGRLALWDEPAEQLIPSPSRNTLASDRRMIAFEAVRKLTQIGYPAFPKLVARLHDRRQSIAISRFRTHDVGTACRVILRDQIYSFPEGFSFAYSRKRSDGGTHVNSYYADRDFFGEDLGAWLTARKDRSLLEIQIEVLTWVAQRERGAGAPTEEDTKYYIVSLENHLENLKERYSNQGK